MNIIKIVNAAESGLVTCSGGDCTVCGIIETVSKIYNFLTGLSFAVAVLFLALAGLVFIFGTGVRKSYFLKAKVFAKNAIIGFVFVLVGWLAIHAVLFSTGYKNAGNWWQFQCATETSTSFQSGSIKSFSPYANIADFIASGNSKGVIQGPVSEAAFQNQISQLKEGETLTFYLPAKDNSTGREIMVPFLAGYKSGGGMKMDAKTISLLIALIKGLSGSGGDLSLLSSAGSILSNPMALIGKLISFLFPSLGQIMGSLGSGGGLSGAALNNAIGALSGMAAKYQPDGTPVGALTAALTNEVVGTAKDALSSVAVEKGQQSSDS